MERHGSELNLVDDIRFCRFYWILWHLDMVGEENVKNFKDLKSMHLVKETLADSVDSGSKLELKLD
jgi:hypothetical protein